MSVSALPTSLPVLLFLFVQSSCTSSFTCAKDFQTKKGCTKLSNLRSLADTLMSSPLHIATDQYGKSTFHCLNENCMLEGLGPGQLHHEDAYYA